MIAYRAPKAGDLDGFLSFINELADEDTYILINKRVKRQDEKKWLDAKLKAIKKGRELCVVAVDDGKIVGNCGVVRRAEHDRVRHSATIGIAVLKKWRGRGIGEELMRRAMAQAKKKMEIRLMFISYLANNPISPYLYRKLGFKPCGKWPNACLYRGKYVDEILMWKWL